MISATKKDKDLVVAILISAFKDLKEDNSINLIVGFKENRIKNLKILMGYLFRKSLMFGKVYISDNKKSCLLLMFSEKQTITFKSMYLDLKLFFKVIGFKKVFKVLNRQKLLNKFYPKKENYIKPIIMGSIKEAYGNGTGARLALMVLNKYKESKQPVIIDTVNEYNVNLYTRFGFKIITKVVSLGFPITILRLN